MEHILAILLLSIVAAFVGFGFKRMQDFDMIFEWYGKWLAYLAGHKFWTFTYTVLMIKIAWNRKVFKWLQFDLNNDKYMSNPNLVQRKESKFLYYFTKPLGRCIICNTTWIGMFLGFILFRDLPLLFINIFTVGVASAGIVVMISNKYELMQNAL
jgi:hypothetical protein